VKRRGPALPQSSPRSSRNLNETDIGLSYIRIDPCTVPVPHGMLHFRASLWHRGSLLPQHVYFSHVSFCPRPILLFEPPAREHTRCSGRRLRGRFRKGSPICRREKKCNVLGAAGPPVPGAGPVDTDLRPRQERRTPLGRRRSRVFVRTLQHRRVWSRRVTTGMYCCRWAQIRGEGGSYADPRLIAAVPSFVKGILTPNRRRHGCTRGARQRSGSVPAWNPRSDPQP